MADTGLLVNSKHKFEIATSTDQTTGDPVYSVLAQGFSSFEPSVNEETDQTAYLDGGSFTSTTVMGGQLTLSFSGHRYFGDVVQDYIFGKILSVGVDRETNFRWTLPTGEIFEGPATIATIEGPSGDANAKGEISVEIHFNGLPTYTPATP